MTEHRRGPADPGGIESMLRHLDGQLPPGEASALVAELRADDAARRRAARLLLQLGYLDELGREARARPRRKSARSGPSGRDPLLAAAVPIAARPRGRRWVAAAVAVTAAAAAVVVVARQERSHPPAAGRDGVVSRVPAPRARAVRSQGAPTAAPPTFTDVEGARLEGSAGIVREVADGPDVPLGTGARVRAGRGVETIGAEARATLALGAGSRLALGGDTLVLSIEGAETLTAAEPVRVVVERGEIAATVTERAPGGAATFVAPLAELTTRAGRFRLSVAPDETRVEVDAGRVEVVRLSDRQRLVVEARQQAHITETGVLAVAPVAALVRGSDARGAELDRLTARRLEGLGFAVVELHEDRMQREDFEGKAVVVVSSSTNGEVLRERLPRLGLRELPAPVVTCENASFALFGMTGPRTSRQRGAAPLKTTVEIEPTTHPMAAGLAAGRARLANAPVSLSWGEPGDAATKIATLEGSKHRRAVLFGYDRGAPMLGLVAPARRVGCFLVQDGVAAITEAGWQLFDAAVRWAASP